jgi:endonuclease/exonuclease/phosphatase family metal-dependent hydrolase
MPLRLVFSLALAVCLGAGCSSGEEEPAGSSAMTIRVMTFNIFYGGDEMKLPQRDWCTDPEGCQDTFGLVVDAIKRSKADVVGLQEATANTCRIADELGWHCDERTATISRYPIIDPGGADGLYVFVEPTPERVVAIANTHLPATPYGPYWLQRGKSKEDVIALEEQVRLPAIQPQLEGLPPLADQGIPVFLTGDFNSPSHHDLAHGLAWPVSKALADAGFQDSFRVANPEPAERPGFTWTPGGPESIPREVHDRIDWVLSAGPARAQESSVVGEADYEGSDVALAEWPSDHRGVASTFQVTPAQTEFVAVEDRSVEQGEILEVSFHTQEEGARVLLEPSGDVLETDDSTASAETESLSPGHYDVVLTDAREKPIATTEFWLYERRSKTTITTSKRSYKAGQPIRVSWENAPGAKFDWIGVFPAGDGAENSHAETCNTGYCGNGNYLLFKYTRATVEGSTAIRPLKPGRYDVRLLLDDGYRRAAISEPFEVER